MFNPDSDDRMTCISARDSSTIHSCLEKDGKAVE